MKKAQTEIMGLAIIVILIIIGLTVVIKFITSKEPAEFKKEFTRSELASNMLNTFLGTSIKDCDGLTVTEFLQDCGQSNSIICGTQKSCKYVEDTAKDIFEKTLEKWGIDYEFKVFEIVNEKEKLLFDSIGNECKENKKSKTFPIPTASEVIFAKLDICG